MLDLYKIDWTFRKSISKPDKIKCRAQPHPKHRMISTEDLYPKSKYIHDYIIYIHNSGNCAHPASIFQITLVWPLDKDHGNRTPRKRSWWSTPQARNVTRVSFRDEFRGVLTSSDCQNFCKVVNLPRFRDISCNLGGFEISASSLQNHFPITTKTSWSL